MFIVGVYLIGIYVVGGGAPSLRGGASEWHDVSGGRQACEACWGSSLDREPLIPARLCQLAGLVWACVGWLAVFKLGWECWAGGVSLNMAGG